jgi:hypothetical protein
MGLQPTDVLGPKARPLSLRIATRGGYAAYGIDSEGEQNHCQSRPAFRSIHPNYKSLNLRLRSSRALESILLQQTNSLIIETPDHLPQPTSR